MIFHVDGLHMQNGYRGYEAARQSPAVKPIQQVRPLTDEELFCNGNPNLPLCQVMAMVIQAVLSPCRMKETCYSMQEVLSF